MNASSAKKIALKVVVAWKSKDRARRRSAYRTFGTATGRMSSFRASMMEVDRAVTLDLSNHPEVVDMRQELETARPDMLMSADQRDAFMGALQAYAVEHGVSIITAQQTPSVAPADDHDQIHG